MNDKDIISKESLLDNMNSINNVNCINLSKDIILSNIYMNNDSESQTKANSSRYLLRRKRKVDNYREDSSTSEEYEKQKSNKNKSKRRISKKYIRESESLVDDDSFNLNTLCNSSKNNNNKYKGNNKNSNKINKLTDKSKARIKIRKTSITSNSISIYNNINLEEEINSDEYEIKEIPQFLKYIQKYDYIDMKDTSQIGSLKKQLKNEIEATKEYIKELEDEYVNNELGLIRKTINDKFFDCPEHAVPIHADVTCFDFNMLAERQLKLTNKLFDVIMMDPPWQISSSNPTRGVSIAYQTMKDDIIANMDIPVLQKDGFIFIWTINSKYKYTLDLMKHWGYSYCDEIVWVKQTVNGNIAKGNGYYLQHTKESCLVGIKGNPKFVGNVAQDVILSKRRGQSQKPEEIYEYIEELVPEGFYLEIFGRRNNLRNYWVTIGNEI